jgi:hypothetical protein
LFLRRGAGGCGGFEVECSGLRGKDISARAFDGQMDAASYTGAVTFDSKLGFVVLGQTAGPRRGFDDFGGNDLEESSD